MHTVNLILNSCSQTYQTICSSDVFVVVSVTIWKFCETLRRYIGKITKSIYKYIYKK